MTSLAEYFQKTDDRPAKMAERLGVEPSTITRIVKGERKPSVELARRIAADTGLTVESLRPDIFGEAAA